MTVHDSWTQDSLVEAYKQHQRRVRGLRERTLQGYEQLIRPFLQFSFHIGTGGNAISSTSSSASPIIPSTESTGGGA